MSDRGCVRACLSLWVITTHRLLRSVQGSPNPDNAVLSRQGNTKETKVRERDSHRANCRWFLARDLSGLPRCTKHNRTHSRNHDFMAMHRLRRSRLPASFRRDRRAGESDSALCFRRRSLQARCGEAPQSEMFHRNRDVAICLAVNDHERAWFPAA